MMKCWQNDPDARPTFTDLKNQLKDMENQHKVEKLPLTGFMRKAVELDKNRIQRNLWSNIYDFPNTASLHPLVYSYFEKRCQKKSTKLHKPIPKGSMGRRIELLHVLNTNEI